jgi:hypothetical protein
MKIKKLIEVLQKLNPELEVYVFDEDGYRALYADSVSTGCVRLSEHKYGQADLFFFDDESVCLEPGERETFINAVCLG